MITVMIFPPFSSSFFLFSRMSNNVWSSSIAYMFIRLSVFSLDHSLTLSYVTSPFIFHFFLVLLVLFIIDRSSLVNNSCWGINNESL